MAARPKRMAKVGQASRLSVSGAEAGGWAGETPALLSAGAKCTWLSFTSGGSTSIPMLRASAMYWLSFSVSAMSFVIMAQKNSTG